MTEAARPGNKSPESSGIMDEARTLASTVAGSTQDAARRVVDERKIAAADQVDEVAKVLDTVAEGVERVLPQAATYVREAASGAHHASSALRETTVEDLLEAAAEFGRKRPAALVGICLATGFGLARFLKSSADRRAHEREHGREDRGHPAETTRASAGQMAAAYPSGTQAGRAGASMRDEAVR